MNILRKFFGSLSNQKESTSLVMPDTKTIEAPPGIIPAVDLFIDNEPPQPEQQVEAEAHTRISIFLGKNYHAVGVKEGYDYHSQETLEMGIKRIRAEFQLIVDQSIQEKSEKRLEMKTMIVTVAKISDEVKEKLELTIDELNVSMTQLQKQKDLSVESEGWVMNAIHTYHQGFVQGLNDYVSGEQLLISIKNL